MGLAIQRRTCTDRSGERGRETAWRDQEINSCLAISFRRFRSVSQATQPHPCFYTCGTGTRSAVLLLVFGLAKLSPQ